MLVTYLKALNFGCLSLYSLEEKNGNLSAWTGFIRKFTFWSGAVLTAIQSLINIKLFIISSTDEDEEQGVAQFVMFTYFLVQAATRMVFIKFAGVNHKNLSKLVNTLQTGFIAIGNQSWMLQAAPYIICILTLLEAMIGAMFLGVPINEWSLLTLLRSRSVDLAKTAQSWGNSTENLTTIDYVVERFGKNMSVATVGLGLSSNTAMFATFLVDAATRYLILSAALTLMLCTFDLSKELNKKEALHEQIWKKYRFVQEVTKFIAHVFSKILMFYHLQFLLLGGYVMTFIVAGSPLSLPYFILLTRLCTSALTYLVAIKASNMTKDMKTWILKNYQIADLVPPVRGEMSIANVLEELAMSPIGIGSGQFHLDENFLTKFLGLLISWSMKKKIYVTALGSLN